MIHGTVYENSLVGANRRCKRALFQLTPAPGSSPDELRSTLLVHREQRSSFYQERTYKMNPIFTLQKRKAPVKWVGNIWVGCEL
jgi:hypothetical protein